MIIYLASGFSVMNIKGREEELLKSCGKWDRLVSFYNLVAGDADILQAMNLKIKEMDGVKETKLRRRKR